MRHNYKNLKIWQNGILITNDISDILLDFPKHERYDLSSQISRCSVSIPSNIAEGSSRTDKSFSHFLDISLGSSFELITQLIVAKHRNGPTGEVDVMFDSATTTFHSVAKNIDAPQYAKRGASLDEAFG